MTAEQRIEYLRLLWQNFQKKAKTQRAMSSVEYCIACRWLDAGVPLAIVLRGLNDFDGKPRRLEAVEASVDRSIAYWHQALQPLEG